MEVDMYIAFEIENRKMNILNKVMLK